MGKPDKVDKKEIVPEAAKQNNTKENRVERRVKEIAERRSEKENKSKRYFYVGKDIMTSKLFLKSNTIYFIDNKKMENILGEMPEIKGLLLPFDKDKFKELKVKIHKEKTLHEQRSKECIDKYEIRKKGGAK